MTRRLTSSYAVALAAAGAATLVRWSFMGQLGYRLPYVFIYPAVLLVALSGGWGPALLCLIGAVVAGIYLFFQPAHSWGFRQRVDALELSSFLGLSLLTIALAEALRRAWFKRDASSNDILEAGNHRELQTAVVHDLRIAEQELRRKHNELVSMREVAENQRQRYQDLFQLAPEAYIVTDLAGKIVEANRAAATLLNTPALEMVGKSFLNFVHTDQRSASQSRLNTIAQSKPESRTWEVAMTPSGAEPFEGAITIALVRDAGGRITDLRWMIRDITEEKRAERELAEHRSRLEEQVRRRTSELVTSHERLRVSERMAAIGTLVAGLGHDLGNLVLPMLCRLDWLAEQSLPAPINQHIEGLRDSALKLRQLTSGLGLFASDAENGGPSDASTSISQWWSQAGPLLQKLLPIHVPLQCELPDDLPPVALARHHLTHVMRALVTNAGESITGQGVVRFWARVAPDGKTVQLGLTDNGHGMGNDVRRHAFEPFFTTKKRSLSTGLGLTVVHGIMRTAGGAVDIQSKPDRGTTVILTIPVAHPSEQGRAAQAKSRIANVTLKDQRIASYARTLLESASFDVFSHGSNHSGKEVLWITEPAAQEVETVRHFLREDPERRVILVGGPSDEWNEPGVEVVDGSHRAMHQALQKAVIELT